MSNTILKTQAGDVFSTVAANAKDLAIRENNNVQFEFNGIDCIVSASTDLDLLYRDYDNAFLMEWKEIGPDCQAEYNTATMDEMNSRRKKRYEENEKRRIEQELKDNTERVKFSETTKGIEVEFSNKESWDKGKAINDTSPYGACIFEYAESWAKLMQAEISKGKTISECAAKTSFQLGYLGITGFMYGAAVSILSDCWVHGNELREMAQ